MFDKIVGGTAANPPIIDYGSSIINPY